MLDLDAQPATNTINSSASETDLRPVFPMPARPAVLMLFITSAPPAIHDCDLSRRPFVSTLDYWIIATDSTVAFRMLLLNKDLCGPLWRLHSITAVEIGRRIGYDPTSGEADPASDGCVQITEPVVPMRNADRDPSRTLVHRVDRSGLSHLWCICLRFAWCDNNMQKGCRASNRLAYPTLRSPPHPSRPPRIARSNQPSS